MPSEDHPQPITIASCVQISTVMNCDLVSVPSNATVSTAAARMAERRTGSCLIMDGGQLQGVITEQDLTRKVVATGGNPVEMLVSDIMSSPVVTLGVDGTVGDAAELMIRHNIRRIVVGDDGETVGIVTARDILGFASEMNTILHDLSGMYGTLMFLDHDMQVLWVNREPEDAGAGDLSRPVHCYELLHGSTSPCPGCPLTFTDTTTGVSMRTSEIVDKDHRVWQVQCHPVSWGEGKILGVIESAIEVTHERELEQALREHQDRLHIAVEGADIETWYYRAGRDGGMVEADGGVVFAPESRFVGMGEMFGYLQAKIHPDDLISFRVMVESLTSGTEHSGEARFRVVVPGGGWRWVRAVCRVVETAPDGTAVIIAGVNIDITDLINYQAAIHRANKKLNLLASVTRHDILNQVSAIMLSGELLELDGYLDGDSGLAEIIGGIMSSAGTIERQLIFTREYEGLGETDPEWQDVCLLAGKAANELGQDGVTVVCECRGMDIYADPMFGNVIYNLIDNAIRHGTSATIITIRFTDVEDGGILTVEDNGSGVPDNLKERIFSRGYGKNTGFGLFLTREILEITGISICECGEPGKGARFEMHIPHSEYRFT